PPELPVKMLQPTRGRLRIAVIVLVSLLLLLLLENMGDAGPRKHLHELKRHAQCERRRVKPESPLPPSLTAPQANPPQRVVDKDHANQHERNTQRIDAPRINGINAHTHLLSCGKR